MLHRAERARGVELRLLDLSGLTEQALEKYNQHRAIDGKKPATEMRVGNEPYAVMEVGGRLYVVCNEGVGWEVTDESPLEVDLYPQYGPGSFGIFPAMEATLKPSEVRARATGEMVDLADLIRTFGARLEDNFWTWHRVATAKEMKNA